MPPLCDPKDGHLLLDGGKKSNLYFNLIKSQKAFHSHRLNCRNFLLIFFLFHSFFIGYVNNLPGNSMKTKSNKNSNSFQYCVDGVGTLLCAH